MAPAPALGCPGNTVSDATVSSESRLVGSGTVVGRPEEHCPFLGVAGQSAAVGTRCAPLDRLWSTGGPWIERAGRRDTAPVAEVNNAVWVELAGSRTGSVVDALCQLGEADLLTPSELPGWSRLTIACHLRYGAETLLRMTRLAIAGEPVAYYPEGRASQRPRTLHPRPGERPTEVIESLASLSDHLRRDWLSLGDGQWRASVTEPEGNPDLGTVPLETLLMLRLTEVEVHGSDLGLGLDDWDEAFVRCVLPVRLDWLNSRRANHRAFDAELEGSWLLVASDGPSYRVSVSGPLVESRPAARTGKATAVIEGASRDVLALLLGRPTRAPLTTTGDGDFARLFADAFPGP